jgi:hypothetical protein
MSENRKLTLVVSLSSKVERGYSADNAEELTLTAEAMLMESENGTPRLISPGHTGTEFDKFAHLMVDYTTRADSGYFSVLPPRVRDVYWLSLADAEEKVKMLRAVYRKLDKMSEDAGYPVNFGQYALRFASAIGAKAFVVTHPDRNGMYANGSRYLTMSASSAESWLYQRESEFRREHGKVA